MPTVLITGANRGIGLEFAKAYAKSGYKTIVALRDPASMPKIDGVITIKLDAASTTDPASAVKELQSKGIKEIDLVIANAAVNLNNDNMADLSLDDFTTTMDVNVRGPLLLFQATLPLLPKNGKFCFITSGAGTINKQQVPGQGAYGLSKAALNFLMRKLQAEHPDLFICALSPGWVKTDMGHQGAKWRGLENGPPDDIGLTVPGMMKLLEEGDKEKIGGWMTAWDGRRLDF
ncbi:MAG: hypothetical protein TREMPRED_000162 [Tremellales sp. Tagirdzhanova-0007]|nr:MAG: hypothetical protein TREMPRED_000162 [Tremellales sp. Tagirdzhanova-0007]